MDALKENVKPNNVSTPTVDVKKTSQTLQLVASSEDDLAPQILRQVEFYFSDENLENDRYLLKETGGSVNRGVPISTIHKFKRMQVYQPYESVVVALRESAILDIEGPEGEETVKRKLPFVSEGLDEEGQKKQKKKSKSRRSKTAKYGTGFEEFYAEPPITPGDYAEERQDYYYSNSFNERIETCIQRYRAKRSMNELRLTVFDRYLILGGIQTGIKAFGGGALDKHALEEVNASGIRDIMATNVITSGEGRNEKYYDPQNAEHWSVDFTAVAKAFLSHKAPRSLGIDNKDTIHIYCNVIENFLNYVLTHSVCPEYTEDILAARKICGVAERELWALHEIGQLLPGTLNKAASTCYGGVFFQDFHVETSWDAGSKDAPQNTALSLDQAEHIVLTAIGLGGSIEQIRAMADCDCEPTVISRERRSFEVVHIQLADEILVARYKTKQDPLSETGTMEPVGTFQVRPWIDPEAEEEDLTEIEEMQANLLAAKVHLSLETLNLDPGSTSGIPGQDGVPAIIDVPNMPSVASQATNSNPITLFLDNSILEKIFIGMKFTCTLHTTNAGFHYFDALEGIYPSFYTFLPNEMMAYWKAPVENKRVPPMVGDKDVGGDDEMENAKSVEEV